MTKKLLILACLLASVAGLATTSMTSIKYVKGSHIPGVESEQNKRALVDGALDPNKIPDHVAYSILFRLVARRETEQEVKRIRAYLGQALGCSVCNGEGTADSRNSAEADVNTLIAVAESFDRQVRILDEQAVNIQARYHPNHDPLNHEDKKRLKLLKKQKKAIVDEVVATLSERLSDEGYAALQRHINQRMKRKIKLSEEQETE